MQSTTKTPTCLRTISFSLLTKTFQDPTLFFRCKPWGGHSYSVPHLPFLSNRNWIPKQKIECVDSTLRDGIQKRKEIISTKDKLELAECLKEAGYPRIEFGSLVKNLESMANTEAVFQKLKQSKSETFDILIPNEKGLERLIKIRDSNKSLPLRVSLITTASLGFAKKNTNCTVERSLEITASLIKKLEFLNLSNRVYLSFAYGGFPGEDLSVDEVADFTHKLFHMGAHEVVLSDTNGKATGKRVYQTIQAIRDRAINPREAVKKLGHHFHGNDLDRVSAVLEQGGNKFDSTVGGIGGCPSLINTEGNMDAVRLLTYLEKLNYHTGIEIDKVKRIESLLEKILRDSAVE